MGRIFDVVQSLSGQNNSISIPRPYLEFFKDDRQSYQLAVVLNQLVFWSGKSTSLDGDWFYKTDEEIASEIGLSVDQIYRIVEKLKNYLPDVVHTKSQKIDNGNKVKHYFINGDKLVRLIFPFINNELVNHDDCNSVPRTHGTDSAKSRPPSREVAEPILYTDPNLQINRSICEDSDLVLQDPEVLLTDTAKRILKYLNEKLGSRYQPCTSSLENIRARLRDGHEETDLCLVVDYLVAQWGNDLKMSKYLRPITLFQPAKFDGYLLSARTWINSGKPQQANDNVIPIDTVLRDSVFSRLFSGGYKPQSRVEEIAYKLAGKAGLGRQSEYQSRQAWAKIWVEASTLATKNGQMDTLACQ